MATKLHGRLNGRHVDRVEHESTLVIILLVSTLGEEGKTVIGSDGDPLRAAG